MKNAFPFLTILAAFTSLAAVSGIHEDQVDPVILCQEVTVEVNRAVEQGIISRSEGDKIISNCFSKL